MVETNEQRSARIELNRVSTALARRGETDEEGELALSQTVRVLLLHGVGKLKKKGELALSQIV